MKQFSHWIVWGMIGAFACCETGALAQQIAMAQQIATLPRVSLSGDWKVKVDGGRVRFGAQTIPLKTPVTLDIAPARIAEVRGERYDKLPLFNANTAGYAKGVRLLAVRAAEVTSPNYLDAQSIVVKNEAGETLKRGTDYEMDEVWATIGRLEGGKIGEATPVFLSYHHGFGRVDSIVAARDGRVFLRGGSDAIHLHQLPPIGFDETRLANIWVEGRPEKLGAASLFPIKETEYSTPRSSPSVAEKLLPKTLAKLRSGAPLKILAWGDSVTTGTFVKPEEMWQRQFVARLKEHFPGANIELVTEAWGGRNTDSYMNEPPGSEHNYREKVLAVKPDLIISEFVNDAGFDAAKTRERYGALKKDFDEIGAEWIIQTPHYVTPSWMGLDRLQNIDDDPRPYVIALREFAAKNNVALSDASILWGRLWRRGIPYTIYFDNQVNHPDGRGMTLFADALMALFPEK